MYCHLFNHFPTNEYSVFPPNTLINSAVINHPPAELFSQLDLKTKHHSVPLGLSLPMLDHCGLAMKYFSHCFLFSTAHPFFLPLIQFKLLSLDYWPPHRPPRCQAHLLQINPPPLLPAGRMHIKAQTSHAMPCNHSHCMWDTSSPNQACVSLCSCLLSASPSCWQLRLYNPCCLQASACDWKYFPCIPSQCLLNL